MARKSRKNILTPVEPKFQVYKAAAYLRLSSDDPKKADSIETQRNITLNFIENNPEIRLHDVYIDKGRTGTNFERPEFKRMLADAQKGIINCIVYKDA
jgi:DNA invertase Pin-like site-specific DNA recombinase